MDANKALEIAKTYANSSGYDTVRRAGEKDGFYYFHIMRSADKYKKIGLPFILGIGMYGQKRTLDRLDEIMWACEEEMKIIKAASQ